MKPILCLLVLAGLATTSATAQDRLAILNVTVVDVTDGTLHPGQNVLIDDNRITSVGPAGDSDLPAGALAVDGTGRFLIPGLWDMHVHTFNNNAPQPPNTWTFPLYLAHGVTGIRDMWVRPGAQAEQVREWMRELDAGTYVGPRFGAVGTLVDGAPPIHRSDTVTTAAEAQAFVAGLADAGIDFVKPYSLLQPEVYRALVEAAQSAGLGVAGHGPSALSSFDVSDAGQRSIEHLTGIHETCSSREDSLRAAGVQAFGSPGIVVSTFDPDKCARLYDRFAENETWQVPTIITNRVWTASADIDALRRDDGLLYTPSWESAEWGWVASFLTYSSEERRAAYDALYKLEQRIISEMHAAGVPLLAGTDFGNPYIYPGISLLDELAELVGAGLSPLAALQSATLNPARYLDRLEDLGTVEPGKLADLVLLDANPLADIANVWQIHAVIANGRIFTHEELWRMKHEVLAANYREALKQPQHLGVQPLEEEALARFVGTYQRDSDEAQVEVMRDDGGGLLVRFGDWIDALEPLGGALFRVVDTNVLYVFHTGADGALWGFEVNDGESIMRVTKI